MLFLIWVYLGGLMANGNHGLWERLTWPLALGAYLMNNCTDFED
jgi:hypothetical protein